MIQRVEIVKKLKEGQGEVFELTFSDGEVVEAKILDVLESEDMIAFLLLKSNRERRHYVMQRSLSASRRD